MVKCICGEYMKKYFIAFLIIIGFVMFVPQVYAAPTKQSGTSHSSTSTQATYEKASYSNVTIDISDENMNCKQLLGNNGTELVKFGIVVVRIGAMVICILQMMLSLIPAITKDDPKMLNKAAKKCVMLAVILAAAFLLPTIIRVLGLITGFDSSCFV